MTDLGSFDPFRTELLGIPELTVLSGQGDDRHFFTVSCPVHLHYCPHCGGSELKNQGLQHRQYMDLCRDRLVYIDYAYYKYKCLKPDCARVFSRPIAFAGPYGRTTHRLEDEIVRLVLEDDYSYSDISAAFHGIISRQVARQLFLRRKAELEADSSASVAWFRVLDSDLLSPAGRTLIR